MVFQQILEVEAVDDRTFHEEFVPDLRGWIEEREGQCGLQMKRVDLAIGPVSHGARGKVVGIHVKDWLDRRYGGKVDDFLGKRYVRA
ncbi:hypothetical protein D3C72_2004660 [compost metagenome]